MGRKNWKNIGIKCDGVRNRGFWLIWSKKRGKRRGIRKIAENEKLGFLFLFHLFVKKTTAYGFEVDSTLVVESRVAGSRGVFWKEKARGISLWCQTTECRYRYLGQTDIPKCTNVSLSKHGYPRYHFQLERNLDNPDITVDFWFHLMIDNVFGLGDWFCIWIAWDNVFGLRFIKK